MRRTKSGLPRYCSWNVDQRGARFVRFRKDGFSTYIAGTPWSEAFMRQYAAALDGVKEQTTIIGAERTKPGSINALIVSYTKLVFPTLKPSTQRVRANILERFRREHGDKPVAGLQHHHIASIIAAKASTPDAANNLRKVLRHLLDHAVDIRMIAANPAASVKRLKTSGEGILPWSEEDVAQFTARHPLGSRAYLAMALALYTGQRLSDVVPMGWQHVRTGNKIAVRQQKTGTALLIPIMPSLAQALESVPRSNMTFLLTERGAPFTKAGFGNWFRDRCREAGLQERSLHGLRKLAATRLADAGCSAHQVAAITGHKTLAEVTRYTRAADQARLAEQAMAMIETGTKLSSNGTPLDNSAEKPSKIKAG
jgi:integrase